jgi:hypothetical protein
VKRLELRENGFGFEPEITAKVAKAGFRIYEVGISYAGRTYEEGKKITWRDGFRAIYTTIKYNLLPARARPLTMRRRARVAAIDSVTWPSTAKIS